MNPIDSKAVEVEGYDPDIKMLSLRFHGRAEVYNYPCIEPTQFAAFMNAESRGKWISENLSGGNPQSMRQEVPPDPSQPAESAAMPGTNAVPVPGILNVIDPEADRCCVKRLNVFLRSHDGAPCWACSECGMHFRPEMLA